ncbi:DUF2309 domain-containing protein [Novosphingobium flavum]|uniref:Probable inorganic carbon transporter subunit DabA n=1 Tax=Novosphingobium aerophilum TaxID=2839843 RepID=A0A7X1F5T7_9SPHN|nr:DUF2309 domain-containing protein [Novosphingobium aerophilum]MBC2650891.1 DUF2309 domain-containing protein [Novosphingobium aerophilum]MBC2663628.1 DUF2309 domain-containing protein [Novosphingobium aerophilum]
MTATLIQAIDSAIRAIPPAWPLAATVAVNPFLGQTGEDLSTVGARLARVAGTRVTMPRAWYATQIAQGTITDQDLDAALAASAAPRKPGSTAALRAALQQDRPAPRALPTVADLAAAANGIDWPGIISDRIGTWAAGWFDQGQALWAAPQAGSAYAAWRESALRDLTPEILGLPGFARHVAGAPEDPTAAIERAVTRLGLSGEALPTALHRLLMTLEGWAQAGRYKLWMAELEGGDDTTARDLLAIRIVWEEALYNAHAATIAEAWAAAVAAHAAPVVADDEDVIDAILQEAAERAGQRTLIARLASPSPAPVPRDRPVLQAAFCIDVRSEVFRRALESIDPRVQTLGFAGFFGLTAAHRRFASDTVELRLPVLLNPGVTSQAGTDQVSAADGAARVRSRAHRAWGRFKLAAVSSFAFVEATGPVYIAKLLGDSFTRKPLPAPADPAPRLTPGLDLPARIDAAETILRAMSLTGTFAPIVLLAGHGANVVNNPHASALHCGACGGYSGEVNARLVAALMNDAEVRAGLGGRGITVPDDTVFVAALHDTTTDAVTLYEQDLGTAIDLTEVRRWLSQAGMLARTERALRLPGAATGTGLSARSRDWAEVRPEWGLAGCQAFIAAPRSRTIGRTFAGRAFLHDYEWEIDQGFKVLELILTAPVVVASWISLQYYGSTVAPAVFGGGNKLIHNVVGGLGVVEGNGGALRTGLPWQSVHDGTGYAHDPLRLTVCVEAPRQAISDILARHPGVRALFDNRWLHLFVLDEQGHVAWRYAGDLEWTAERSTASEPVEDARLEPVG